MSRITFYTDEHVSRAAVNGLRQRGAEVLTVVEAGLLGASDEEHIHKAREEGRVITRLVWWASTFLRYPRRPLHAVCLRPVTSWLAPGASETDSAGMLKPRHCFDEKHLRRMLMSYFSYYHHVRPHQSLGRNAPYPRKVESPEEGEIISVPLVD